MQRLRSIATRRMSPAIELLLTLIAFVIAFGLRYELEGSLPPGFPYLTFFPAVILTGFFVSTRAGVAVAVLCGLASWYYFLAPTHSWRLSGPAVLALVFYVFICATDLALIHMMRLALLKLDNERRHSDRLAQQNKTMFHEFQHRVSNNLQVIGSLIKMQQRNVSDPAARAALQTASSRLRVVSTIQRQLHNPKRQTTDIGQLLKAILPEVTASNDASDRVELQVEAMPLVVSGDQATPVALIAVELVSNAMEHALVEGRRTTIRIEIGHAEDRAFLRVCDDGPGLPEGFQPERSRSLGLRVAYQFTEQLEGVLSFRNQGGTVAELSFPLQDMDVEEE